MSLIDWALFCSFASACCNFLSPYDFGALSTTSRFLQHSKIWSLLSIFRSLISLSRFTFEARKEAIRPSDCLLLDDDMAVCCFRIIAPDCSFIERAIAAPPEAFISRRMLAVIRYSTYGSSRFNTVVALPINRFSFSLSCSAFLLLSSPEARIRLAWLFTPQVELPAGVVVFVVDDLDASPIALSSCSMDALLSCKRVLGDLKVGGLIAGRS